MKFLRLPSDLPSSDTDLEIRQVDAQSAASFATAFLRVFGNPWTRSTDLARQSGVTQADISRIERGQLTPSTPTMLKLIEAMHGQLAVIIPALDAGGELSQREPLVALRLV